VGKWQKKLRLLSKKRPIIETWQTQQHVENHECFVSNVVTSNQSLLKALMEPKKP
jgi:hypothetical protein